MSRVTIIALAALLGMTACASRTGEPSRSLEQPQPAGDIEGTLTDDSPEPDGGGLEGQVLVWPAEQKGTSSTTFVGLSSRPLEAVLVVDSQFSVQRDPGWYRVRGTDGVARFAKRSGSRSDLIETHELTSRVHDCPTQGRAMSADSSLIAMSALLAALPPRLWLSHEQSSGG